MVGQDAGSSAGNNSTSQVTQPRPKRRWVRRLVIVFIATLIVLAVFTAFLPMILSTGPGTRWTAGIINTQIPGGVSIDRLNLSWSGGQKVEGLVLADPNGKIVLDIGQIDAPGYSLWSAARGGRDFGKITITNRLVQIERYDDGSTNLTRALTDPEKEKQHQAQDDDQPWSLPKDLKVELDAGGGTVTWASPGVVPVQLSNISLSGRVDDPSRMNISFQARAAQDSNRGTIDLHGTINDLFDRDGRVQIEKLNLDARTRLVDVPVAMLDAIIGGKGKLTALLGATLHCELDARGTINKLDGKLVLHSQSLQVQAGLLIREQTIRMSPGSEFRLTVTPQAWATLAQIKAADGSTHAKLKSELKQPFDVIAAIENVNLPRNASGLDLATAQAKATLITSDVVIDAGLNTGPVTLRGIKAAVELDAATQTFHGNCDFVAHQNGREGPVHLELLAQHFLDEQGKPDWNHLNVGLSGAASEFPLTAVDQLAGTHGLLAMVLGDVLNVNLQATLRPGKSGELPTGSFTVNAQSASFESRVTGRMEGDQLRIDPGTKAALTLDPAMLEEMKKRLPALASGLGALGLAQPMMLLIEPTASAKPLATEGWRKTRFAAKAWVNKLVVSGDDRLKNVQIRDVTLHVPECDLGGRIGFDLTAALVHLLQTSKLRVQGHVDDLLTGNPVYKTAVHVDELAVGVIDAFAKQPGLAAAVLGQTIKTLDISAENSMRHRHTIGFRVDAVSDRLQLGLGGRYEPKNRLVLEQGAAAEFAVTPQGFTAWQQWMNKDKPASAMTLDQPANIKIKLDRLELALQQGTESGIDPARTGLNGRIDCPLLALRSTTPKQGKLEAVQFKDVIVWASCPSLSQEAVVDAQAVFLMPAAPSALNKTVLEGRLTSRTTVAGLVGSNGKMDPNRFSFRTATEAKDVPVRAIDELLGMKGKLAGVVGPLANLTITGGYQPDKAPTNIDLVLDASNVKARIPATIDKNLVVTLREDGRAAVGLTPESGAALGLLNPMMLDALGSDQPVQITLDKREFSLPIQDFALNKVRVAVRVETGTLTMKSGKTTNDLLSLISNFGGGIDAKDTFRSNLTPMEVRLQNGELTTNDLWLSTAELSRYGQVTFGMLVQKVDLTAGKAQITLGISGETLAMIPFLKEVFEPGYVYEVPIKGSFDKLEADYGELIAQIAKLKAKSEITRHLGQKNPWAAILAEGALEGLVPLGKRQEQVTARWPNRPKDTTATRDNPQPSPPEQEQFRQEQAAKQKQPQENQKPKEQKPKERPRDPLEILLEGLAK